MKAILPLSIVALVLATGCFKTTTPNTTDQTLFNIETNVTPIVTVTTNVVATTNMVATSFTNDVGSVTVTFNPEVSFARLITQMTNNGETYTFSPKPEIAEMVGGAVNTFAPGWGALAALIAGGGLMGAYGKVRQNQLAKKAGADIEMSDIALEALAHEIEVLREIVKETPQGAAIDAQVKALLQKHQIDLGQEFGPEVTAKILDVVHGAVNNKKAKEAARSIMDLFQKKDD